MTNLVYEGTHDGQFWKVYIRDLGGRWAYTIVKCFPSEEILRSNEEFRTPAAAEYAARTEMNDMIRYPKAPAFGPIDTLRLIVMDKLQRIFGA